VIRLGLLLSALALLGCSGSESRPAAPPSAVAGEPVQFGFGTIDGGELSSDNTRGRVTLLLFVTTYDLPSQAEAQLVRDVVARHQPRANAGFVMMEPPHSAALAQVWRDSLGLKLPVAMAGPDLLAGESPLGRVAGIPTLVVLDRRGRLVSRHVGAATREQIIAALRQAEAP
jgi:hypothetical protein